MNRKTLLLTGLVVCLIVIGLALVYIRPNNTLSKPQSSMGKLAKEIKPSETYIEYADPSGFKFIYPDNLSISKAEIEDSNTYADIQLFSKDVNGSLSLRITDTKLTSLDGWLKANKIASSSPVERKLGNLKALEVKTTDRLFLGALDQGVLFTIESPLMEQDFWMKVYNIVLSEFAFVSPDTNKSSATSDVSSSDITFEGEEVVE